MQPKRDDDEEASTPRMDEASPLQGAPPRGAKRASYLVPALCAAAAVGAVARRATASSALYGQASAAPCTDVEKLEISKYTITSSQPTADAAFAQRVLGSVDQSYGGDGSDDPAVYEDCLVDGKYKMRIRKQTIGGGGHTMDLHFPYSQVTPHGPLTVQYWDKYQANLNKESFATDVFNPFMHYSLVMYTPDLSYIARKLTNEGEPFLARRGQVNGQAYYTLVVGSPTGKVYEITSPRLDEGIVDVKDWSAAECPACHVPRTYNKDQLDAWWYDNFGGDNFVEREETTPIRVSIAVSSVDKVQRYWAKHFPALDVQVWESGTAKVASANFHLASHDKMSIELEWVENTHDFGPMKHTVSDFVAYQESVKEEYAGPNIGWTAWYDRHLGVAITACPLDEYMKAWDAAGVAFHAHATGTLGDHAWTEGVESFGIEFQGWFDYSYQSNYAGFDFCTWNTDPHEFYYTIGEDPPAKPDPSAEAEASADLKGQGWWCFWC